MSRVTEIRHVGYAVKDFAQERAFYLDSWRLKEVAAEGSIAYFAAEADSERYVVRLREAEADRIDVIALATETAADVDTLYDKVCAAGCQIIFAPHTLPTLGGGYGFRFFSPDGLPFEISSGVADGSVRALAHWEGIPRKISHVVIHSPDNRAAVAFFTDVLGFKISDWLGDFMCFLRCNEWHHRIGIMAGPPSLHHVAYDMPSIDDLMRGINRLKTNDIDIGWGPGRHTAGNNVFSYFTTPAGFVVEYTAELEKVDFENHEPMVHTPGPFTVDQWGTGVGGPQTMPHAATDPSLFQPAEI